MKTLVWVEHDGSNVKDATLSAVTAAAKLGEVHLLVAGEGVDAVAPVRQARNDGGSLLSAHGRASGVASCTDCRLNST